MSATPRPAHWDSWVRRVADKSEINSLVFLQLGAGHLATAELLSEAGYRLVAVSDYLDAADATDSRIVLTGLESLATAPGDQRLGELRQRVQQGAKEGTKFVLQSTAPRVAFPIIGSQILMDATFETGPGPDAWARGDAHDYLFERQIHEGMTVREVLPLVLRQLGLSICAQLDRSIFEGASFNGTFDGLDSTEIEALYGAGLTSPSDGWRLGGHHEELRRALTDVLDGFDRTPAHVSDAHASMAALTSRIRRTVRAAGRAQWGRDWARELLPTDVSSRVVSRAARSVAPAAIEVADVRDPLVWLSLRELFSLRKTANLGDLGVPAKLWDAAEPPLAAIEDRLRYMGHLTQNDSATVAKWSDIFVPKLSHSGHLTEQVTGPASQSEKEILGRLRADLASNPAFVDEAGASFFSLVTTTVRFLKLTADTARSYTRPVSGGSSPLESELQDHFYWYLGGVGFGDTTYLEVPNIATGRVDVVVLGEHGVRFVTEVKREFKKTSHEDLAAAYFGQASDYQVNNVPLGQLLVLDLSDHTTGVPSVDDSVSVQSVEIENQLRTIVIFVVHGNRPAPSDMRLRS